MKIARFEIEGRIELGVVRDEGIVALDRVGFGYFDMLALIAEHNAQVFERLRHGRILVAVQLLLLLQCLAIHRFGLSLFACGQGLPQQV